jgi:hypothetical protein
VGVQATTTASPVAASSALSVKSWRCSSTVRKRRIAVAAVSRSSALVNRHANVGAVDQRRLDVLEQSHVAQLVVIEWNRVASG